MNNCKILHFDFWAEGFGNPQRTQAENRPTNETLAKGQLDRKSPGSRPESV
jgi:hypothetical protein